jgi:isocitrate lyase
MTQQAPNQEILYVSGWACSSLLTSTNEVSPDFGDYPYNTVPNQVQRLFKAQSMHDRKQWDTRRKMTADQRKATPYTDYMRPIVADGDTGYDVHRDRESYNLLIRYLQTWRLVCCSQARQAVC